MLFNIKFPAWTARADLEIEIPDATPLQWRCRAALEIVVKTGTNLRDADLRGADLLADDLRHAVLNDAVLNDANLRGADLSGADLSGADLSGADLSGAEIPIIPNIDAAILASIEANKMAGKNGLAMNKWHGTKCDETNWCQTTHCRAGYAICLAGKAGFDLERKVGAAAAGALIYAVSRPGQLVPNFYVSDQEAIADIKASAVLGGA